MSDYDVETICRQVITLSASLAPDPITRFILNCLTKMIAEQTESIDQKLDRMIGGYYKTGLNYLRDANILDSDRRQKWIEKAIDQFMFASSVESTSSMQAKSKFYAAVCYSLLGERIIALQWYEQAYEMGYKQRQEYLCQIQSVTVKNKASLVSGAGKIGGLHGFIIVGAAVAATAAIDASRAKKATNQLTNFDNELMIPLKKLLESWPSSLAVIQQPLSIPGTDTQADSQASQCCSQCGNAARPNALYCGSCGAPFTQTGSQASQCCSQCGNAARPNALYCGSCGAPFGKCQELQILVSPTPQRPIPAQPMAVSIEMANQNSSKKQALLTLLKSFHPQASFYVSPNIPNGKLTNARQACNVPQNEQVLALIDCTIFDSAKDCVLFGSEGVYCHEMWTPPNKSILYTDFSHYTFTVSSYYHVKVNNKQCCVQKLNRSCSSVSAELLCEMLNAIKVLVTTQGYM